MSLANALKGLKKTRPEINRRIIKERQLKAYEISPDWGAIAPACVLAVLDPGGEFSHWHGIRICACLLGYFFAKFGIAIGGFSSETKEPKLHKLGVFWANYCKKHPIWSKLGAFLSKMVYWWVGNLSKNWYRDSQIFEVRQAHPRTILVKEPPPPGVQTTIQMQLVYPRSSCCAPYCQHRRHSLVHRQVFRYFHPGLNLRYCGH